MDLTTVLNIIEIHLGPSVDVLRKMLEQRHSLYPVSPAQREDIKSFEESHFTISRCLCLCTSLVQEQTDLSMGHLTRLQRLGCITEIFSHIAQRITLTARASSEGWIDPEERLVFDLLLALPCYHDLCLIYAKEKVLANFLLAFPDMLDLFFGAQTASVEEKVSAGCCLQDTLHHLSKTNSQTAECGADRTGGSSAVDLVVKEVLPKAVSVSSRSAVAPLIYFFTRTIEYGHHSSLIVSLQQNGRKNFDRLMKSVLVSAPDQLGNADIGSYIDALCLLDKFFNYAADMGSLASSTNQEVYADLSSWIVDNAEILVKRSEESDTFAFADKVERRKNEEGNECCCENLGTLTSVLLKALCVQARSLDREDPEVAAKFLLEMGAILELLRANCDIHRLSDFGSFLFAVFGGDDEDMCGAMLCCLHLCLLLEELLRHRPQEKFLLEPTKIFDMLIDKISSDHWIIVSWITDDQNCFLVYFMQYLRHVDSQRLIVSRKQTALLRKIEMSLKDSQKAGTLAFDCTPLLRRIRNVTEILSSKRSE